MNKFVRLEGKFSFSIDIVMGILIICNRHQGAVTDSQHSILTQLTMPVNSHSVVIQSTREENRDF